MTIILSGGGSGGHITPILAVAAELKRRQPKAKLVYIGQTGDSLGDIPAKDPNIDQIFTIRAGKLRRYHGEGLKQLLDLPTLFKNLRDSLYVVVGIWQSWRLLRRLQPDIIFIKGGFVGVPVGLAAVLAHIPYITHDSDAVPGLANRLIAPWAKRHAVALPAEVYPYAPAKTVTTGIPVQSAFRPVTPDLQKRYRKELDLPANAKVLFVIGGGLGSQNINQAVTEAVPHLLRQFKDLYIRHIVGRANQAASAASYQAELSADEQGRVKVYGYLDDVYRYSGAADLVVSRAGATNLAEFALQGKACIVIPSPFLAGGHQLKNADYLAGQGAAIVLEESELIADPHRLARQVSELIDQPKALHELGAKLAEFAKPKAAADLAQLILDQAKS